MDNFFILAAQEVFSLNVVLLIVIGTFFGILAGAIPGFTVTMGIVLAFPFTFAMEPTHGLALMVSILVGGYSGGIIPGVMLGIPGTPTSIVTVFDGYPMALKGQAGRALGIGIASSFLGNLIGVGILIAFAPVIARFSLEFGPWEIAAIVLFALTLVGSMSQGAMLKGCIVAGFGILISTAGIAPTGQVRFNFGFDELNNGVELLPVLIGAFAFSQLMANVERKRSDLAEPSNSKLKTNVSIPFKQILRDIYAQKFNILRSSGIGAGVGAIPAVGGTTSTFISYDQAKRYSKNPDEFGKGHPGGIAAAEASNNATLGGVMIPTLTLGIPGDITMAIMYGVLVLYGLQPGPMLFVEQPVLVGSIYVSLLVSGLAMVLLMLVLMRYFVRIAQVPLSIIVPMVLMLATVGAYALNNNLFDVFTMFAFGIVGYLLVKGGIPLAPLILGVILGPELETNFFRAIQLDPNLSTFVTRPVSAVIIALTVLSVALLIGRNHKLSKKKKMAVSASL